MSLKKKLAAAATLALAITGVGLTAAAPANAAAAWDCPSGYACSYDGVNGVGRIAYFQNYLSTYGASNDKTSSVFNNGKVATARFYQHANYGGWYYTVARGQKINVNGAGYDNQISSGKFI